MSRVSNEELQGMAEGNWSVVSMSAKTLTFMARELRAQRKVAAAARELHRNYEGWYHSESLAMMSALAELDALEDGE